jgi:hypothetical protein
MREVLRRLLVTGAAMTVALASATTAAHAKTITVNERATLMLKRDGTKLTGRGTATGTLPGTVSANLRAVGLGVQGTVKLSTRGGSLTIKVAATLSSRTSGTDHLRGTLAVRSGTGKYADAVGGGVVTATLNRKANGRGEQRATVTASGLKLTY